MYNLTIYLVVALETEYDGVGMNGIQNPLFFLEYDRLKKIFFQKIAEFFFCRSHLRHPTREIYSSVIKYLVLRCGLVVIRVPWYRT